MENKTLVLTVGTTLALILVATALIPAIDSQTVEGRNTLDVVILGGQSNAAYVAEYMDLDIVNEELDAPSTNCYAYQNGSLKPMYENGQWVIGGEECAIGYYLGKKTNDDVLVINVGYPALSIENFLPGTAGGNRISTYIPAALDLVPDNYTVVKCGWVWCQGESDKTTPYSEYVDSFEKLQTTMASLGFDVCYMVKTKPSDSGNASIAQGMILENVSNVVLASNAPATFTVDNGGLIPGNTLHYSQHGRIIVGEDIAEHINATHHDRNGSPYSGLFSVIPILIIVGVVSTVALVVLRREA